MRACPKCESEKNLLVALQLKGSELECPNCYERFPNGTGREVSKQELIALLTGGKGL